MNRDNQDALMEQLLREILGGDRPRDMTARVLAQAKIYDRFRHRWWISAGAAIAASVVLAASLFFLWPQKYPGPEVHGVALMNSNEIERGTTLQTDDVTSGSLKLGNYVDIVIRPQTSLTLGGGKFQEKVFLEQGELQVSVQKNKGEFDIAVGPATVHVTGTRFNVNVLHDETNVADQKKLLVAVDDGSVEVNGIPGTTGAQRVSAGEKREFVIFYTPKVIPPVNAALRGGLLAAAQEGARIGNRGGIIGKPLPETPSSSRAATATGATAPVRSTRPVQFIFHTSGGPPLFGKLRYDHGVYYLETAQAGNVYMFSDTDNPKWPLPVGQSVRVTWTGDKVTDVTP
jgi:hypothetical protein